MQLWCPSGNEPGTFLGTSASSESSHWGVLSAEDRLNVVVHELRTPITIVRGNIELLEAAEVANHPDIGKALQVVHDEFRRMGRLIEDLVTLSDSDAADFVVPSPLRLRILFAEIRMKVAGLGIRNLRMDPPPDVTIYADSDRLVQALLNPILNSATHNPPDIEIVLNCYVTDELVSLQVADNGRGIEANIRDRVFEPFVRGAAATRTTGLGLAITKLITEAHGGCIDLTTSSAGTTIALRLPSGLSR